jgi:DNA-binding MarR family transcriptional regulator
MAADKIPLQIEALVNSFLKVVRTDPLRQLTTRQVYILLAAYAAYPGPVTIKGLHETMEVDKPALTRGADTLEQLDLLRRRGDPADRRSIDLVITSTGRRVVERLAGL